MNNDLQFRHEGFHGLEEDGTARVRDCLLVQSTLDRFEQGVELLGLDYGPRDDI